MNLFTSLLGNNNEEGEDEEKTQEKSFDFFCCFHAKDYFDIEEDIIFARIRSAIFLRPSFDQVLHDKPDLYGPFWIASSLIVVIIATSSLMHFFNNPQGTYNFDQLAVAATLIYGVAFGCPYLIAIMVKIFGGFSSVVELICLYGYSMTSFLPVTIFCFIQSYLIQSILLLLAFMSSSIFLIRGIVGMSKELNKNSQTVLIVFIVGVQLLLVFMYKFYFFDL